MKLDPDTQRLRLSLEPVVEADFEGLLALRIEALRPSLERIGRFDAQRARELFAAGFAPPCMHHIVLKGAGRVGLVTLKPQGDGSLRLHHLYLRHGYRGLGIGAWVVDWAKQQAGARAIDVAALKESDANRFYLRHGFVAVGEEVWDLHYRWQPPECKP